MQKSYSKDRGHFVLNLPLLSSHSYKSHLWCAFCFVMASKGCICTAHKRKPNTGIRVMRQKHTSVLSQPCFLNVCHFSSSSVQHRAREHLQLGKHEWGVQSFDLFTVLLLFSVWTYLQWIATDKSRHSLGYSQIYIFSLNFVFVLQCFAFRRKMYLKDQSWPLSVKIIFFVLHYDLVFLSL